MPGAEETFALIACALGYAREADPIPAIRGRVDWLGWLGSERGCGGGFDSGRLRFPS
jgi:hypothetical protein